MRLLLVTRDASLTVGTSMLPGGHDVAVVGSADALRKLGSATFDVAVVDARTAADATDLADRLVRQGRARRALLISDEPVAGDERVRVLARPFTVAELERQLAEVAGGADVATDAAEPAHTGGLRGWWQRWASERVTGTPRPGVASVDQPVAPTVVGPAGEAGGGPRRATHPPARPRAYPRFRTVEEPEPDRLEGRAALLHRALRAGRELEQLLARAPETADLRAVAAPLLDAVVAALQPAQAAVWVIADDGTWQAVVASGMDVGVRAPPQDPLLGALRDTVDAVLVHRLEGSAVPATDGPVVAAALRVADRVDGAITAAAGGLDLAARDRLLDLARSGAPAYALACLLDRLRSRRFVRLPEATRRPPSRGSGASEPGRAPAGGPPSPARGQRGEPLDAGEER